MNRESLETTVNECSKALRAFPKGAMGLTPNWVKASTEYQTAKANYVRAFAALRQFNANR